jgi:hypothetical protein
MLGDKLQSMRGKHILNPATFRAPKKSGDKIALPFHIERQFRLINQENASRIASKDRIA